MGSTVCVLDVPQAFYDDHVSRDLPAPRIIKRLSRTYRCEGTREEWDELRSDAAYYAASGDALLAADFPGLVRSARATLRRIDRHCVTEAERMA